MLYTITHILHGRNDGNYTLLLLLLLLLWIDVDNGVGMYTNETIIMDWYVVVVVDDDADDDNGLCQPSF